MPFKEFGFNFKKENIKYLRGDYAKWLSKMNDLEELMKTMIVQINAKRFGGETNRDDSPEPGVQSRVRIRNALTSLDQYSIEASARPETERCGQRSARGVQSQHPD